MYLLKKYVFVRTYKGGPIWILTGIVMIFMTIRMSIQIDRIHTTRRNAYTKFSWEARLTLKARCVRYYN